MKNKTLIIIILILILFITGGTYAFFSWQSSDSQQTKVTFTVKKDYSCSVDGGGNIISTANFGPTNDCNSDYAIKKTIKITVDVTNSSKMPFTDVWLNINEIGSELTKSRYLKYALTTNDNSCSTGIVSSGTFTGKVANNKIRILNNKLYTSSTIDTYYLYIWLDSAEDNNDIMNQSFSLSLDGECFDIVTEPEVPVLDNGMIPIVYDTNGTDTLIKTISSTDSNWYNYDDKKWANAVLVSSTNRDNYLGTSGVIIPESDILAYYVWIPRYKYKIWTIGTSSTGLEQEIDIQFEDKNSMSNGTTVGSYLTHPAFWWDKNSDGVRDSAEELSGIWVGKFETTGTSDAPTIKPNELSLRNQKMANGFKILLKFAGGILNNGNVSFSGSNTYGLSDQIDSHVMKNSEWGAASYLSHSQYGINSEVYVNNSASYYTARSGGNIGGFNNTVAMQYPNKSTSTSQAYNYGYYTWDGRIINYNSNNPGEYADDRTLGFNASTTGNMYGIYDMSGGASEYTMSVYQYDNNNIYTGSVVNNEIIHSGFIGYIGLTYYTKIDGISLIELPQQKYYNRYTSTTKVLACNGSYCFGQAFTETSGWYNDSAMFFAVNAPWVVRGGYYNVQKSDGIFYCGAYHGGSSVSYGFRSVLVNNL